MNNLKVLVSFDYVRRMECPNGMPRAEVFEQIPKIAFQQRREQKR